MKQRIFEISSQLVGEIYRKHVAIRIFNEMEAGVEDITTDAFADNFVQSLKSDAKGVEKQNAQMAHQPAE